MQRLLFILSLMVFIVGCSEVYMPDIDFVDAYLTIEGSISTQPGDHYVLLSYSRSYNERPYYSGKSGADVNVIDDEGNRIHYEDMGGGIYKADITENNAAQVGSSYYLEVVTEEGTVFRSAPQLVVPCPDIDRLYCKYDNKTILTENVYGDILEQNFPVITLKIETTGILPSDNFYFYQYIAYEEHHSYLRYLISEYQIYRHRRLSAKYSNIIHTVNADEFGNFKVRDDELMYIEIADLRNYEPIFPDSFTLTNTRFEGLLFKLSQYSLSSDAYTFYRDAEDQLNAEGRLFDPAFTQITGNIECVSEPVEKVKGVFYAADVSDYYAYMHINTSEQTYSKKLDSFPELWLDTCSWGAPDDWIRPPF